MPRKRPSIRMPKPRLGEPAAAFWGPGGEVLLYQAPDGKVTLDVRLDRETIWLSLNQMAALFERDKSVISRHIRNVFKEGELDRSATVAKYATAQTEGGRPVTRQIEHFNLDAILCLGRGGGTKMAYQGYFAKAAIRQICCQRRTCTA